jgi:peroxiredoxin
MASTLASILVLGIVLVSVWAVLFVLYLVVKQQGRLLLRLDGIEEQLGMPDPRAQRPVAEPQGLAVGTPFPSFTMSHLLTEQEIRLEDFRGKRLLLVNWSPQCGFCDMIAGDLAKLKPELQKQNVELLFLAHGDAEKNRALAEEHGLKYPIVLIEEGKAPEPFQSLGTPSAYLLDQHGKVARPLAVGADAVPRLAQEAAGVKVEAKEGGSKGQKETKRLPGERSLAESKIERNGLKPGTLAPLFTLPDVYGKPVSLESYRGKRVLLVFSDPHCGPCQQLAPELARIHREHLRNNLAVIMVGRGDVEENRRKAEEHRGEFPVVIQEKWKLSKEYGMFATPAGYLIDENGVIARSVAQGTDAILALAPAEVGLHKGRVL